MSQLFAEDLAACLALLGIGFDAVRIFEPAVLLPLLVTKPGSWSHSPERRLVNDPIRDWLARSRLDTRPATVLGWLISSHRCQRLRQRYHRSDSGLITLGHDPSSPALDKFARGMAQGSEPNGQLVNLSVYDQLIQREATT